MNLGVVGTVALNLLLAAQDFEMAGTGVSFTLRNSASPAKHQIETMPGGVALLDYDADGRLDVFFVNGAPQPALRKTGPLWWNRLYRNLGDWQFKDVTEQSGLTGSGFGMGAAAADYDNDGHTDLLVTGVGFNTLYKNLGGRFADVTRQAGIPATGWSVSAGWFDMDNDGDLDLFIVNYVHWDPKTEPFCGDRKAGYRTYCHPKEYTGLPNTLLRNNGDGTFADVSKESGIAKSIGKGMGLAFTDVNADGLLDVFVTNDTTPNFLFRNEGEGRFREIGVAAGVAIADDGRVLSSMGADARDVDGDGAADLFVTALANETFPLFRNLGKGLFEEITYRAKLAAATLPYSGWSTGLFDFDNDGWVDIFCANGDVQDNTERYSSRRSRQENLWFRNLANGTFAARTIRGEALHRGAAFGDLDGDGRIDVVLTRLNEPALMLRNTMPRAHWLAVRLIGKRSNRDSIGARIELTAGGRTRHWTVSPAGGYLASNTPVAHFGLGELVQADRIEVIWPSGAKLRLDAVAADRYLELTEP